MNQWELQEKTSFVRKGINWVQFTSVVIQLKIIKRRAFPKIYGSEGS